MVNPIAVDVGKVNVSKVDVGKAEEASKTDKTDAEDTPILCYHNLRQEKGGF